MCVGGTRDHRRHPRVALHRGDASGVVDATTRNRSDSSWSTVVCVAEVSPSDGSTWLM